MSSVENKAHKYSEFGQTLFYTHFGYIFVLGNKKVCKMSYGPHWHVGNTRAFSTFNTAARVVAPCTFWGRAAGPHTRTETKSVYNAGGEDIVPLLHPFVAPFKNIVI